MSKLLFRLNGVSDNEANDVRQLLEENHLAFYETTAGRWGLSVAAIWLVDLQELEKARQLIAEYQKHRTDQRRISPPDLPSFCKRLQQAPIHYLLLITAILAVLYLSTAPFLSW